MGVKNQVAPVKVSQQWEEIRPIMDESWNLLKTLFGKVEEEVEEVSALLSKKQYASAQEKKVMKGYSSFMDFPDLVRGALLVEDNKQVVQVVQVLFSLAKADIVKMEVKNGTSKNPYRGAVHLDLKLGQLTCEIQVMTKKTWAVKKTAHKAYKKGKAHKSASCWKEVVPFTPQQLDTLAFA